MWRKAADGTAAGIKFPCSLGLMEDKNGEQCCRRLRRRFTLLSKKNVVTSFLAFCFAGVLSTPSNHAGFIPAKRFVFIIQEATQDHSPSYSVGVGQPQVGQSLPQYVPIYSRHGQASLTLKAGVSNRRVHHPSVSKCWMSQSRYETKTEDSVVETERGENDHSKEPQNRGEDGQSLSDTRDHVLDEAKKQTETTKLLISRLPSMSHQSILRDLPPIKVEDTEVLFYDVFLLLNLSLSISFWVVHRLSIMHIGSALSEGSLLCILWVAAGLYNGSFLFSALDGHYDPSKSEGKGGPPAAGMLGLWTFVLTANLRIGIALLQAIIEHRPVGAVEGEQLIPLEILFGLVLMSAWRALHSSYVPRL